MTKDDAGESRLNHVQVTATDTTGSHPNELANTFWNFLLDNRDGSLCCGDSEHEFTVVRRSSYVVVVTRVVGVLEVVELLVELDEEVDVVVEELVEVVGGSVVEVVVVVAEMICSANSVILPRK